jgi:2-amino-4-hydroxy-6-hydroxymethyldihydropteridine diphosphokinase
MSVVYLSLGSNIGDREDNLKKAVDKIKQNKIRIIKESRIYETKPYGIKEQRDFLNLALKIETTYTPQKLIKILLDIEKEMGRVRDIKWGPRIIDIDILFYDSLTINDENLKIPHPDLHNRLFVLEPLSEIAPDFIHPIYKRGVLDLLNDLKKLS